MATLLLVFTGGLLGPATVVAGASVGGLAFVLPWGRIAYALGARLLGP